MIKISTSTTLRKTIVVPFSTKWQLVAHAREPLIIDENSPDLVIRR